MTDDKQFNNFEATVILRKAMAMKKINIEDDPLYKQLEEAKWEREVTKYLFTGLGTTMNLMILYGNRYRMGLPWVQIVGRMSGVIAFWTFFYWTSPGVRKYNQVLIDISKGKKKELLDLFQPTDIKKSNVVRNPSSKAKTSAQRTSPYSIVSAVHKAKHQKQSSEELSFRPIMVTFIPSASSEVTLKPDYPNISLCLTSDS